jgi:hypothetical protein
LAASQQQATAEDSTSEPFNGESGHSQPSSVVTTMDSNAVTVIAGLAFSFREKSIIFPSPQFLACLILLLMVRFLNPLPPCQDMPFSLTLNATLEFLIDSDCFFSQAEGPDNAVGEPLPPE